MCQTTAWGYRGLIQSMTSTSLQVCGRNGFTKKPLYKCQGSMVYMRERGLSLSWRSNGSFKEQKGIKSWHLQKPQRGSIVLLGIQIQ